MMSDEEFIRRLIRSKPAVERVAKHINTKPGFYAEVMPQFIRPSRELALEYADSGDIRLYREVGMVDVKHYETYHFTCMTDFPYRQVLVDNLGTYSRKEVKPLCHYIVSDDLENAVVVPLSTFESWEIHNRPIKSENDDPKDCYYVNKDILKFLRLR